MFMHETAKKSIKYTSLNEKNLDTLNVYKKSQFNAEKFLLNKLKENNLILTTFNF